jgi:hypothetical protein
MTTGAFDRSIVPLPPPGPPARGRSPTVSNKVKAAIALLLGMEKPTIAEAAAGAGMSTARLREALAKPHVRRFYYSERKVLIDAISAGNPLALKAIRDREEGNEMAKVAAIKQLEQMVGDEAQSSRSEPARVPGVVIIVTDNQPRADEGRTIEVKQLPVPQPAPDPTAVEDGGFGIVERGIYRGLRE